MNRCEACRCDYYGFARTEIPDRLRAAGADPVERLTETPAAFLRERPLPGWSADGAPEPRFATLRGGIRR